MDTQAHTDIPTLRDALEGVRIHHARRAKAEALADTLAAEYTGIALQPVCIDEGGAEVLAAWEVVATQEWTGDEGEASTEPGTVLFVTEDAVVPALADILDVIDESFPGYPVEGDADDEEQKPSGSVVPETYRASYRENSSTGQSCGDFLAEWLATQTLDADGKLDVSAFDAILDANGVERVGKWASLPQSGQKGWVGRYRMNGRQVLEKRVAISETLRHGDGTPVEHAELPAAIADLQAKHAKWLAKERKAIAAAEEALPGKPEAE